MGQDWIRRPYRAEWDEAAVMYLWMKSLCHTRAGIQAGAHVKASPQEVAFWDEHRPVLSWLLEHSDVEVLMDPERVEPSSKGPTVLWAFAATTGDVVHGVVVKRSAVRAGFGPDMIRDLLGDRFSRRCAYTLEIPQMRPRGPERDALAGLTMPGSWFPDHTWLIRSMVRAA